MTDAADTGAPTRPGAPQIRIMAQFIRDLSFENPRAPESLRMVAGQQPTIDMQVEMNARGRPDGLFEVDLKLGASSRRDNDVNFHVELLYGGLFELTGIPEEQLEVALLVECPRYLFPFARRVIADMTAEGGFPPFLIEPIDFAGVYEAQRRAEGRGDGEDAAQAGQA
jgi:preprotein translocase subunit SecB